MFETPPGQVAVSPSLAARLSEPSEGNSKHPASLTNAASPASVGGALSPQGPFPDWAAIVEQVTRAEGPPWFSALARKVRADWKDGQLRLFPGDGFTAQRLREPSVKTVLDTSLAALGCAGALVEVCSPEKAPDSRATLRKEILDNPLVQLVEKTFDARIIDHGQLR